ncbi:hypothetical protein D3C81_1634160 [compost metagenome]
MVRRVAQDLQHQVQAIVAGTQRQIRLVRILLRQRVGLVVGDVRRVGDDQFIHAALQAVEQVALDQLNVVREQALLVFDGQR